MNDTKIHEAILNVLPEKRKPEDCKYGIEPGHGCECSGYNTYRQELLERLGIKEGEL